ncbi:hypothetical protein LVB77_07470 [Lysobacter sp. 5GHs7-4]|uniref:hypothetical protein n=1 Tax=Lysobacter sp. 5GHs7-4 TaxID=2904253 RepID=UPI001E2F733C|nr:hypothetical protein [Lysobacter sp. 5GHs7-4]UHQ24515.1 hypothetical protein LVB77_07470 [Lysobacter sp. 5GHs7-4]
MPSPGLGRDRRADTAGRPARTNPDAAGFRTERRIRRRIIEPRDADRARFVIEHRFRWRRVFTQFLRDDYTPPT